MEVLAFNKPYLLYKGPDQDHLKSSLETHCSEVHQPCT